MAVRTKRKISNLHLVGSLAGLLALGSAIYGALPHIQKHYVTQAEEALDNVLSDRAARGFVHESRPKFELTPTLFSHRSHYIGENGNNKVHFVRAMLPIPDLYLSSRQKGLISHEAGHAYLRERIKKLKPEWAEKFENFDYAGAVGLSPEDTKRVYWNYILPKIGPEAAKKFMVIDEGIATYFELREGKFSFDGFTKGDDSYKQNAPCSQKRQIKDIDGLCATDMGARLVHPIIDKYGPKAIDAIILNLPTDEEMRDVGKYHQRIDRGIKG